MSENIDAAVNKALFGNALSDEEVGVEVRKAFTFLAACVDGEIAEIKVNERIAAANALLQYAIRRPDVLADVANMLGMASGDDVAAVATLLE